MCRYNENNPPPSLESSPMIKRYNAILVPVRTSFGLRRCGGKRTMYQAECHKECADVSSVSSSSEQRLKEFFGGAEKVGIAKCHIICTTLYVQ